jgi:glutamate dehydrogenase/leucine dehydrogenase
MGVQSYARGVPATSASTPLGREFGHEQVEIFHDAQTGLTGAIAVHSTVLGPAMGGLRIWAYPDLDDLVVDALCLSRAMTLKTASAGLELGGGKAVLLDDGNWVERRTERLRAFATIVDRLEGRYVTAQDVGTTSEDMAEIGTVTRFVAGRPATIGGTGNPSGATARTEYDALVTAFEVHHARRDLSGVRVGVLGVGEVGSRLAAMLHEAGADLVIADVAEDRAATVAAMTEAEVVVPDALVRAELDVLAPCGLGGVIAAGAARELRCRVVVGAANNPLADDAVARELHEADILYVPDFLANCGGIIQVAAELLHLSAEEVQARTDASVARTAALLHDARARSVVPLDLARGAAQLRLAAGTLDVTLG